MVAFSSDRSGNQDIWIQSVDGGSPVQVTNSPAHDAQPDWSGRRALSRLTGPSEAAGACMWCRSAAVPNGRLPASDITRAGRQTGHASCFTVRISRVACSVRGRSTRSPWTARRRGKRPLDVPERIRTVQRGLAPGLQTDLGVGESSRRRHELLDGTDRRDPCGREVRPGAGGAGAAGRRLRAFRGRRPAAAVVPVGALGRRDLYSRVFPAACAIFWKVESRSQPPSNGASDRSGSPPALMSTPASPSAATDRSWRSPCARIAFVCGRSRFDAASGRVAGAGEPITAPAFDALSPVLSRDGTQLLYSMERGGKQELWRKSIADGRETLVVPGDQYRRISPVWSYDNTRVMYVRTTPEGRGAAQGRDRDGAGIGGPGTGAADGRRTIVRLVG